MTKIALVTGGSKGIGYAAARALYDIGYTVIVAARNEETLQQCAQELAKERFIPLVADVTDESAVVALFAEIKARFGRLDLLFNNAGNNSPAKVLKRLSLLSGYAYLTPIFTRHFCVRKRRLKL